MGSAAPKTTECLFSYGTLQMEEVQLATFGRLLAGQKDSLPGYTLSMVEIDNPDVVETSGEAFHPILKRSASSTETVEGMVFQVTMEELMKADSYEVSAYKRIEVILTSGLKAWVYADAKD